MDHPLYEYYQHLALQYEKARFGSLYGRYLHRQEFQFLSLHLRDIPPARALDLACGAGRLLAFADTGLDFSPNMLDLARLKWPDKHLVCADALALPFPPGTFQAVYTLNLIRHFTEEQTRLLLNEIYRVLVPGGTCICNFPSARRQWLTGPPDAGHHRIRKAYTLAEWTNRMRAQWKLTDCRGALFFPIHRIPPRLRWSLRRTDDWFCQHVFKEYASFLLVCMKKI